MKKLNLHAFTIAAIAILVLAAVSVPVVRSLRGSADAAKKSDTVAEKNSGKVLPSPTPEPSPLPHVTVSATNSPVPPAKPTAAPTTAVSQAPQSRPLATNTPVPPAADTEAPRLAQMTGPADGSTVTFNNFCFPMMYSDNLGSASQIFVKWSFDGSQNDWGKEYAPCFNSVANGQHTFTVQAKDSAGNTSATTSRTFTVNAAANQLPSPTQAVTPEASAPTGNQGN